MPARVRASRIRRAVGLGRPEVATRSENLAPSAPAPPMKLSNARARSMLCVSLCPTSLIILSEGLRKGPFNGPYYARYCINGVGTYYRKPGLSSMLDNDCGRNVGPIIGPIIVIGTIRTHAVA